MKGAMGILMKLVVSMIRTRTVSRAGMSKEGVPILPTLRKRNDTENNAEIYAWGHPEDMVRKRLSSALADRRTYSTMILSSSFIDYYEDVTSQEWLLDNST